MQTESMPNDIGMPLEQGQPKGHGGGKVFLNGCKATKGNAWTISQVTQEMLQVVAGHPLRYSAKN